MNKNPEFVKESDAYLQWREADSGVSGMHLCLQ